MCVVAWMASGADVVGVPMSSDVVGCVCWRQIVGRVPAGCVGAAHGGDCVWGCCVVVIALHVGGGIVMGVADARSARVLGGNCVDA